MINAQTDATAFGTAYMKTAAFYFNGELKVYF